MGTYTNAYIKQAHKHTLFNEKEIAESSRCTCFYCGYIFDPGKEKQLSWIEEESPKGNTLLCPLCSIDVIIGDASGYPVEDGEFIRECSEYWFNGYSRISAGLSPEKIRYIGIEVP